MNWGMVAYTGGLMKVAGFLHPVVVDLEGLSIDRQNIPIRLDHNPKQGVAANQKGALAIEGVFEFPKPTGAGTDAAVGTLMYWDVADGNAQETADTGTNKLIGKLVKACSETDTTCWIKLDQ